MSLLATSASDDVEFDHFGIYECSQDVNLTPRGYVATSSVTTSTGSHYTVGSPADSGCSVTVVAPAPGYVIRVQGSMPVQNSGGSNANLQTLLKQNGSAAAVVGNMALAGGVFLTATVEFVNSAPVPGTACSPSMPGAAANTDAIPRLSTQACTTVSTAVTPPIPTPAARYQRVAAARRSSRGSTGPRARRPALRATAPAGARQQFAADFRPALGQAAGLGARELGGERGVAAAVLAQSVHDRHQRARPFGAPHAAGQRECAVDAHVDADRRNRSLGRIHRVSESPSSSDSSDSSPSLPEAKIHSSRIELGYGN